jgi:phosphatidate phosphatase LPIN
VVSDIDGTITKWETLVYLWSLILIFITLRSDALGHLYNMIGRDWTHAGIAKLYTNISKNGYKIVYLTSRAIGQADTTRNYLKAINQDGWKLPPGPVIMSPDRLMTSLHR